jgi:hypothetical protein
MSKCVQQKRPGTPTPSGRCWSQLQHRTCSHHARKPRQIAHRLFTGKQLPTVLDELRQIGDSAVHIQEDQT